MNAVQSRPAPFKDKIISQPSPKTDQEPHSPGAPDEPPVIGGLRHREGAFVPALLTVLAGMVVVAGMAIVITAGFALSFDAIRVVGRAARIRPDWAWLLPAAIDGAMAVATVPVVVLRRIHQPTAYPWAVVLINAAISVACNGLHAFTGSSVSLPPIIAMAVSARSLLSLLQHVHGDGLNSVGKGFIGRFRDGAVPRPDGIAGAPFVIYHGQVDQDSDGPIEWCWPVPDEQATQIAAGFPDLALRTEAAHQEAFIHLETTQVTNAQTMILLETLLAWAGEHHQHPTGGIRQVLAPNPPPSGDRRSGSAAVYKVLGNQGDSGRLSRSTCSIRCSTTSCRSSSGCRV